LNKSLDAATEKKGFRRIQVSRGRGLLKLSTEDFKKKKTTINNEKKGIIHNEN